VAFWKPKKNSVIIKIWQVNLATWQAPNARPGGQIGVISPQIPRTVIEAMSEKTPMSRGGRCGCGPVGQAVASAEDSQTFSQHQSSFAASRPLCTAATECGSANSTLTHDSNRSLGCTISLEAVTRSRWLLQSGQCCKY